MLGGDFNQTFCIGLVGRNGFLNHQVDTIFNGTNPQGGMLVMRGCHKDCIDRPTSDHLLSIPKYRYRVLVC